MIEKLTSYAYDDITQKLDEVIDAINEYESLRHCPMKSAHSSTSGEKSRTSGDGSAGWRTRDGDHYIGRRWGPHDRRKGDRKGATAWKLKAPEVPVRDRMAGVLWFAGLTSYETPTGNGRDDWNEYRLKLADAIIKELGL